MPTDDLAYWMSLRYANKIAVSIRQNLYTLWFKRFYNQNECYDVNPLCSTDERFGKFQSTLDAEMKRLHGSGLGTV